MRAGQEYLMTGWFEQNGRRTNMTGRVSINEDGLIEGGLTDDVPGAQRKAVADGRVFEAETGTAFQFYRLPSEGFYAVVRYDLRRKEKNEDLLAGEYEGEWTAVGLRGQEKPIEIGLVFDTTGLRAVVRETDPAGLAQMALIRLKGTE